MPRTTRTPSQARPPAWLQFRVLACLVWWYYRVPLSVLRIADHALYIEQALCQCCVGKGRCLRAFVRSCHEGTPFFIAPLPSPMCVMSRRTQKSGQQTAGAWGHNQEIAQAFRGESGVVFVIGERHGDVRLVTFWAGWLWVDFVWTLDRLLARFHLKLALWELGMIRIGWIWI